MEQASDVLCVHSSTMEFESLSASEMLAYSFTEKISPSGFKAWPQSDDCFWVHNSCREILADFSVQALNYPVARKIVQGDSSDLIVGGAYGATMDLARVADFLAVRSWFVFDDADVERLLALSGDSHAWVTACLALAQGVFVADLATCEAALHTHYPCLNGKLYARQALESRILQQSPAVKNGFDYSVYEMVLRDHPCCVLCRRPMSDTFRAVRMWWIWGQVLVFLLTFCASKIFRPQVLSAIQSWSDTVVRWACRYKNTMRSSICRTTRPVAMEFIAPTLLSTCLFS